jgi:hypothetical protein
VVEAGRESQGNIAKIVRLESQDVVQVRAHLERVVAGLVKIVGLKIEIGLPSYQQVGPRSMSEETKKQIQRCMCEGCRRKLGLVPFECRCGMSFCALHRQAEDHKCTFDYRNEAKKELLKYMSSPVISAKVGVI